MYPCVDSFKVSVLGKVAVRVEEFLRQYPVLGLGNWRRYMKEAELPTDGDYMDFLDVVTGELFSRELNEAADRFIKIFYSTLMALKIYSSH